MEQSMKWITILFAFVFGVAFFEVVLPQLHYEFTPRPNFEKLATNDMMPAEE
jgi:hypothetical protein